MTVLMQQITQSITIVSTLLTPALGDVASPRIKVDAETSVAPDFGRLEGDPRAATHVVPLDKAWAGERYAWVTAGGRVLAHGFLDDLGRAWVTVHAGETHYQLRIPPYYFDVTIPETCNKPSAELTSTCVVLKPTMEEIRREWKSSKGLGSTLRRWKESIRCFGFRGMPGSGC